MHYFGFMLGQFVFILAFMNNFITPGALAGLNFKLLFWALVASHATTFALEYIGNGAYLRTSPGFQMFTPYGRVFVQQFVVVLGGVLLYRFNLQSAAVFLVLLVVLKTMADIGGYLFYGALTRERLKGGAS